MAKKPAKRRKPSLVSVSYSEAVKAFERAGFKFSRQAGSHMILTKPGHAFNVVIPAHRPVAEGTLKQCIRAAGLTIEQFADLLER